MSSKTNIQWTDVTDNIITVKGGGWWCRKISPGCANCYASKLNQNGFYGGNKLEYSGQPPELELRRDILSAWARQRLPKRHFVSSMTDVFGEWVPVRWISDILDAMAAAPKQTFQILTKRADVMNESVWAWLFQRRLGRLPDNIWLGVSVEDQHRAEHRIPKLINIPARVRFLSVEPLLGPINLAGPFDGDQSFPIGMGIQWVIVGGESGPGARPCYVEWIRRVVQLCRGAECPVFVKQIGTNPFFESLKEQQLKIRHPKGGDPEEWPEDLRVREFPETTGAVRGLAIPWSKQLKIEAAAASRRVAQAEVHSAGFQVLKQAVQVDRTTNNGGE